MLIENTAVSQKLLVEHGMSVYIENGDSRCLFGTGSSTKLINNAKRMKLYPENIDAAIIPHNHLSYTGGIDNLLQVNPKMKIFALNAADCSPYRKKGLLSAPVGDLADRIKKNRDNFVLFNSFQQVSEGFFLLKDEIGDKSFYVTDKSYKIKTGAEYVNDELEHECFGVIFPFENRNRGCVILGGCAHCGLPNMIRTVYKNWGSVPVLAILTGLHFMGDSSKKITVEGAYIDKLAKEIKELNVGAIYTCHCTGLKGYEELREKLGNQLQYLQTGEELNF
jgi:7,8-dihydropterin-6-yl-methyl-4-(beta-D-ribofuranosyl)aminobenzene 5'-phosphate synthase